jgi:hypothetical protein
MIYIRVSNVCVPHTRYFYFLFGRNLINSSPAVDDVTSHID